MRRFVRLIFVLLLTVAAIWLSVSGWHAFRVRSLATECGTYERSGNWVRLMRSAREWMRMSPESREARQAGAKAGRVLRDVNAVAEFLKDFPRALPEDVPWLSMLADLEFGPLNQPLEGSKICHEILRIIPSHRESHQRLVYFYAMTQQQVAMQSQIETAMNSDCELPESYVYGFLGSGLRLQNGSEVARRWLAGGETSELLLVALALHISQSLNGAIPTVDDATSENLRLQQKDRETALAELLVRYPDNQELLAYLLLDAMETGMAARAGELLVRAPPSADNDFRFWHVRGWVFAHVQDYDEAQLSYLRAIKLNPLDWRTRFHMGELQRVRGELKDSVATNQLAVLGRSLEKDLLEQPDMRSIPIPIYQRLSEYCQQCGSHKMAGFLSRFLSRSDVDSPEESNQRSLLLQPE